MAAITFAKVPLPELLRLYGHVVLGGHRSRYQPETHVLEKGTPFIIQ